MVFSFPASFNARVQFKVGGLRLKEGSLGSLNVQNDRMQSFAVTSPKLDFPVSQWSFSGGLRIMVRPQIANFSISKRCTAVQASWLATSHIASSVFTLGTVAVLPFYTLMVVAPKAELTKKSMESSVPYVALGLLYVYLLYLSWTPDTWRLIFANKYMLPELPAIAKMFSSETTLASAWIHLLVVDLFAARQVYHDGLDNQIETRHSISLCLFFCPVGLVAHFITRALTKSTRSDSKHGM
ncbi:hypothetical protein SAY86_024760 [Trapa natans]|uniref:Neoxanthin synthase n=1 Tax=Trapa natans TaxID=22666 RepID=A0AAN7M4W0_TRANT|nr:hypothetical protein SAY86_024760 [Trapa natans]